MIACLDHALRRAQQEIFEVTRRGVSLMLFAAISAVSAAAILVRLVPEMHPISIAFWRTAVVALLLAPTLLSRGAVKPSGSDLLLTVAAGLCLALHFWSWFASLQLTTVMRSTVLVCLTPIWAGIQAQLIFRAPPSRRFWGGIAVAVAGVGVIALGGEESRGASLHGDLLALLGGMLSGTYLTIGRVVRPNVDWGPYGAALCASCAGWLLLLAIATGVGLGGLGAWEMKVLLAMALGPQLLGHVGFAVAVRYVPAYIIGALILLEPVGATALGALLLDEWPGVVEAVGALIVGGGVMGATLGRGTKEIAEAA